jgi:hypothetical protein
MARYCSIFNGAFFQKTACNRICARDVFEEPRLQVHKNCEGILDSEGGRFASNANQFNLRSNLYNWRAGDQSSHQTEEVAILQINLLAKAQERKVVSVVGFMIILSRC